MVNSRPYSNKSKFEGYLTILSSMALSLKLTKNFPFLHTRWIEMVNLPIFIRACWCVFALFQHLFGYFCDWCWNGTVRFLSKVKFTMKTKEGGAMWASLTLRTRKISRVQYFFFAFLHLTQRALCFVSVA